MRFNKRECLLELCLGSSVGMAENDTARVLYLIVKELAKVLHIHLALVHVGNHGKAVELYILCRRIPDRSDNVRELSDTRGLDDNSVGRVLVDNLSKCLAEVSYERAADASRIHLGYIDARVLEKSAVNAYLAELVFYKNQLLSLVRFSYELIYKSCLSCSQKAGNNIYLCHYVSRASRALL